MNCTDMRYESLQVQAHWALHATCYMYMYYATGKDWKYTELVVIHTGCPTSSGTAIPHSPLPHTHIDFSPTVQPRSLYTSSTTYRISALALSDQIVVIKDKLWVSIRVPRGQVTRTMVLHGKKWAVHCCLYTQFHTCGHYCTCTCIVSSPLTRQNNPSVKVFSLEIIIASQNYALHGMIDNFVFDQPCTVHSWLYMYVISKTTINIIIIIMYMYCSS